MNIGDLGVLALRALAGGALVVVFALIAEAVSPKAFSGLFAAAPSVSLASLAITVAAVGTHSARQAAIGMTVGGVAMAGCCVVTVTAIPRLQAVWGSAAAWAGWGLIGCGLYWAVFVGAH
jgi:uncharacterized protein DUF3147